MPVSPGQEDGILDDVNIVCTAHVIVIGSPLSRVYLYSRT